MPAGSPVIPRLGRAHRRRRAQAARVHACQERPMREEARSLLPSVRKWLQQLKEIREWLREAEIQLETELGEGQDLGDVLILLGLGTKGRKAAPRAGQ